MVVDFATGLLMSASYQTRHHHTSAADGLVLNIIKGSGWALIGHSALEALIFERDQSTWLNAVIMLETGDPPVNTKGNASMRWCPARQRIQKEAELVTGFFPSYADGLKDLQLHL